MPWRNGVKSGAFVVWRAVVRGDAAHSLRYGVFSWVRMAGLKRLSGVPAPSASGTLRCVMAATGTGGATRRATASRPDAVTAFPNDLGEKSGRHRQRRWRGTSADTKHLRRFRADIFAGWQALAQRGGTCCGMRRDQAARATGSSAPSPHSGAALRLRAALEEGLRRRC